MPFSQSGQISAIIQTLEQLQPQSILDVGVGMGQYGYLARMNLEHLNLFEINDGKARLRDKKEWKIQIDGIEGFAEYLTPVHHYVYNQIFIGHAEAMLPTLPESYYEMVMAVDILEHFTMEDAKTFVDALKRVAKKNVLVSTPKNFIEQEVEANPLENHRSFWSLEDLQQLGFNEVIEDEGSWIVIFHKQ